MDNVEEMDKFLEKYNFPKLNWKEIERLNRPITGKEIETVIKIFQQTKVQDQMASQVNSVKHFERVLKFFIKLPSKEYFQAHYMKPPSVTLIPKPKIPLKKKIADHFL